VKKTKWKNETVYLDVGSSALKSPANALVDELLCTVTPSAHNPKKKLITASTESKSPEVEGAQV